MTILMIRKSSGEIYWESSFDTLEDALRWADNEKARPYWLNSYVVTTEDRSPPPLTPAELAVIAAAETARLARLALVKKASSDFDIAKAKFTTAMAAVNTASTLAAIKPAIMDALNGLAQAALSARDVIAALAKESLRVDQE